MLRPPPETRSLATRYDSGVPPSVFAAISCSFFLASLAAACAARVIACVVWLPPCPQVFGRYFDVLPQVTSHLLPRHAEELRRDAVHVEHRLGAEVADARLNRRAGHPA